MRIISIFTGQVRSRESQIAINTVFVHGTEAWANVQGKKDLVRVCFDANLPERTSWFDRWIPHPDDPIPVKAKAVYRRSNPAHSIDEKLWSSEKGLLIDIKEKNGRRKKYSHGPGVFHGMDAWAEVEGLTKRVLVQFDELQGDFPSLPELRSRVRHRKTVEMLCRTSRKKEIDAAYYAELKKKQILQSPKASLHISHDRADHEEMRAKPLTPLTV